MWHAIEVQGRDYLFSSEARGPPVSYGSSLRVPCRVHAQGSSACQARHWRRLVQCAPNTLCAMPARAASARCDIPVSARAATTLRARARVSSFGAASASAADGVSGRRFALTPAKNTTASRRHPSVALPGPTGDVICLPRAGCYAKSATAAPYRLFKYLLYIGLCSGFSVDNPRPYSQVCVNARRACSQFCAPSGRRSVNNFANGGPFWEGARLAV